MTVYEFIFRSSSQPKGIRVVSATTNPYVTESDIAEARSLAAAFQNTTAGSRHRATAAGMYLVSCGPIDDIGAEFIDEVQG